MLRWDWPVVFVLGRESCLQGGLGRQRIRNGAPLSIQLPYVPIPPTRRGSDKVLVLPNRHKAGLPASQKKLRAAAPGPGLLDYGGSRRVTLPPPLAMIAVGWWAQNCFSARDKSQISSGWGWGRGTLYRE